MMRTVEVSQKLVMRVISIRKVHLGHINVLVEDYGFLTEIAIISWRAV
jgi:hypothetical protein